MAGRGVVKGYVASFVEALYSGDGTSVGSLLSLPGVLPSSHPFSSHAPHAPLHPNYTSEAQRSALCSGLASLSSKDRSRLEELVVAEGDGDASVSIWSGVLSSHLSSLLLLSSAKTNADYEAAYNAQHACLDKFLNIFADEETNWLVPALHVVAHDTVYLMHRLEVLLGAEGTKESVGEQLNTLVTSLRNAFSLTVNHRVPKDAMATSKKWGALYLANILISIFYRADQLRQCKFFISAVEGHGFPPLSGFPLSQTVTYQYYTGVLAMYEDQFSKAEVALGAALKRCHKGYPENRRRILTALIPVRMYCMGVLPSKTLLRRHRLEDRYGAIVDAVRSGNLADFADAMELNREWYIRTGVYLLLERLQLFVYRTLFKHACRIVAEITGSVQIKLPFLQAALRVSGADLDMDEVECILANLIHRKLIKGYLSHQPPVMVLSKKAPFAPLPEVLAATGPAGRGVTVPDV